MKMKGRMLMLLASLGDFFCLRLGLAEAISTEKGKSNSSFLNFDDISTTNGLGRIPNPYTYFSFFSFDIFKPKDPALVGWVTKHDHNCAVTSPNALIGSRYKETLPASLSIADADSMASADLYPFFTLHTFYIKPMEAPPPGTTIFVKGYSYAQDEPFTWHVEFINDYHLPFLVKMQEYSHQAWNELYKVEFYADFGEDALDWEFCIDDLEVQFIKIRKGEGQRGLTEQQNLPLEGLKA